MLNRESLALNAGTDYFPERELKYNLGDYAIITGKNHPWYGEAIEVVAIQQGIFDTVSDGSPGLDDGKRNLHVALLNSYPGHPRTELIISTNEVTKLEGR